MEEDETIKPVDEAPVPELLDTEMAFSTQEDKVGRCRSVDTFTKLGQIGEGTYGIVYRAVDTQNGSIVALKKIRLDREKDGVPVTSLREIKLLKSIRHPHIVQLKEVVVGHNVDSVYLVYEYCEHDLAGLFEMRGAPFTEADIKCLMVQLLSAISYLHDNWIIHRDLKVSNLLYNNHGYLKLADFGLARFFDDPIKPYSPKVVTLWYRAPELLPWGRASTRRPSTCVTFVLSLLPLWFLFYFPVTSFLLYTTHIRQPFLLLGGGLPQRQLRLRPLIRECTWLSPDAHRVLAAYFGCYPLRRTGASGFPPEAFRGIPSPTGAVTFVLSLLPLWAIGCIFAEFILRAPLFPARNEIGVLDKIAQLLGSAHERIWPGYNSLPQVAKLTLPTHPYNLIQERFNGRISAQGQNFLSRCLLYDPRRRITARDALNHPYFRDAPLPKPIDLMPTFPATVGEHRAELS
ncbi:putative Cyclin-dependent kinase 10 [Paratrimastix pyriformis]|uniref:Cyclin-dependent kinase 10 n=1 Tax=Paratrimastix pyriformis TaxID=342808 RepID=A0ABQ8UZ20_9EUKA|nr:putative Cyclin-dependent kinase 10 [Paratrimastix pyriformis]